jgi:apolipoprotein N-acyltransferase
MPGVLSIVSAVALALAFPSFDLAFLAWGALAPFLFALRRSQPGAAAALGFLFGAVLAGGLFWWLGRIVSTAATSVPLLYAGFALYFLAFGVLYRLMSRITGRGLLVGAPALWVALEYARANLGFLAFPWNLLGHSQHAYLPVVQVADVAGVYGISFLVVLVNQVLSELPDAVRDATPARRSAWMRRASGAALVLAAVLAYGTLRLAEPEESSRIRVAVVQANVLSRQRMPFTDQVAHLEAYRRLSLQAAESRPLLIVWPSSSLPAPVSGSRLIQWAIPKLARETESYFLVGGAGGEKFGPRAPGQLPYSNTEFLVAPSGRFETQYSKMRLTPFDEYLPLAGLVRWPAWLTSLRESFRPGTEPTVFHVGEARFGVPICWETTFPDVVRRFTQAGARFIVVATNEGFFGPTSGPYQTLAMTVFRAVENRVAVVRAATTGVSAFIDARGRVVRRVTDAHGRDLGVAGTIVWDVPLSTTRTFYTAHGDVFAWGASGLAGALLAGGVLARRARRAAAVEATA